MKVFQNPADALTFRSSEGCRGALSRSCLINPSLGSIQEDDEKKSAFRHNARSEAQNYFSVAGMCDRFEMWMINENTLAWYYWIQE